MITRIRDILAATVPAWLVVGVATAACVACFGTPPRLVWSAGAMAALLVWFIENDDGGDGEIGRGGVA